MKWVLYHQMPDVGMVMNRSPEVSSAPFTQGLQGLGEGAWTGRGNYYWSFSLTSIGSSSRWFTQDNLSDLRSCGRAHPRGRR